ncbi:MAG: single-stranded DNA-binding protein [Candidatus Methylomirabilia bacterium]
MAGSVNVVVLVGNLTRDPELRYTPSGMAVTSFGLAVSNRRKVGEEWKDEPCFVDVKVFGRMAETSSEYLSKGRPVAIEGRLAYSKWEKDGQTRSKLEVVANNIQFLGQGQGQQGGKGGPAAADGEGAPDLGEAPF